MQRCISVVCVYEIFPRLASTLAAPSCSVSAGWAKCASRSPWLSDIIPPGAPYSRTPCGLLPHSVPSSVSTWLQDGRAVESYRLKFHSLLKGKVWSRSCGATETCLRPALTPLKCDLCRLRADSRIAFTSRCNPQRLSRHSDIRSPKRSPFPSQTRRGGALQTCMKVMLMETGKKQWKHQISVIMGNRWVVRTCKGTWR